MAARPLQLDDPLLIGRGLHRECYQHPENGNLCVKVVVAGNSDENRRESRYYRQLEARTISWDMLARFHGLVDTSRGEGAVFDLVRDFDGEVSRPLHHYLESPALSCQYSSLLRQSLPALKFYLLENRVVTMTLKSKNILVQRLNETLGKLVIVDNVGNSDFIPLSHYSAVWGRMKIRRKWQRFERDLSASYAGNEALKVALAAAGRD